MTLDISDTIAPKSNQLNADDLIAGPRTITIRSVKWGDTAEQPVALHFEGDNNKPYMPCKSMRRVLVFVWGADASKYAGRSMTIYRDPGVMFGGQAVGGIRISHMTDITKDVTMALTATRANRKPFTVKPLKLTTARQQSEHQAISQTTQKPTVAEDNVATKTYDLIASIEAISSQDNYNGMNTDERVRKQRDFLREHRPELSERLEATISAAFSRLFAPNPEMENMPDFEEVPL